MSGSGPTADFSKIDELVGGYRPARIIMAATELGVFEALGEGASTAADLARILAADPRGIRIVCDALVALGILDKSEGRYRNSEEASRFLVESSPESRAASVRHGAILYRRWGRLAEVVRRGRCVRDDEFTPPMVRDKKAFAAAMADIGRTSAAQTVAKLDLSATRSLLDIGGGPGVYAIEFAGRNPGLVVTILDDAETLKVADRNVTAAGLQGRIRLRPGDASSDELGGPYDCIFISNLIHIYGPEWNRRLVARCATALEPGGRLVIKDFLLDAGRVSPAGSALFAVNMLVNTEAGDCYTAQEIGDWMDAAGLRLDGVIGLTEQSSLLMGRK